MQVKFAFLCRPVPKVFELFYRPRSEAGIMIVENAPLLTIFLSSAIQIFISGVLFSISLSHLLVFASMSLRSPTNQTH